MNAPRQLHRLGAIDHDPGQLAVLMFEAKDALQPDRDLLRVQLLVLPPRQRPAVRAERDPTGPVLNDSASPAAPLPWPITASGSSRCSQPSQYGQ